MGLFGTEASLLTDIGLIFVQASAISALIARYYISKKKPLKHMIFMTSGVVLLWLFLLVYISNYIIHGVKLFGGPEEIKLFYYIFLLIHMIGSAIMGFLTTLLVIKSLKRFDSKAETEWKKFPFEKEYRNTHKKLGPFLVLLWLFSAISGLIVYLMLYVFYSPLLL